MEFSEAYKEGVAFCKPYITFEVCAQMARLNPGMHPDATNVVGYLVRSAKRYEKIFERPVAPGTWLEVGVMFPAFPIALALMGFQVTAAEEFSFYPPEIQAMYAECEKRYGIHFLDINLTTVENADLGGTFDYASLLAVIEHLPYTPRILMQNLYASLNPGGRLYVDVPNIYYAYRVWQFLSGRHIQTPIDIIYSSDIPFTGHHREYNQRDLRYVLQTAGFEVNRMETLNYSGNLNFALAVKSAVRSLTLLPLLSMLKPWREVLFAESTRPA